MKPIQSKPISNAKQDAQQLLAEIRIAEAQISAGLGTDNASARSVIFKRLAERK